MSSCFAACTYLSSLFDTTLVTTQRLTTSTKKSSADTASRLLKPTISRLESAILARSKWSDDVTVTHNDAAYMRRHYENFFNAEQAVTSLGGVAQHARVEFAKEKFKPMYYIKMYDEDLSKLEMCFDCTNYQAQFPPEVDFDRHVFQTIFLNKKRDGHLWSIDEIDKVCNPTPPFCLFFSFSQTH